MQTLPKSCVNRDKLGRVSVTRARHSLPPRMTTLNVVRPRQIRYLTNFIKALLSAIIAARPSEILNGPKAIPDVVV